MVCLLIAACCLLASFGVFSDSRRRSGKNMFGGYGQVCMTGNPMQHYYYDDTTFYYLASAPSWNSHVFHELYAYDLAAGESYSVCKRISCDHKSAACPIHRLYQNDYGTTNGYWSMIDNEFIAPHYTKNEMPIIRWNPLTDSVQTVKNPPRYTGVSDSEFVANYQNWFNDAMRLTENRVLVGYNNKMYVCNNRFEEQFTFPSQGLAYPLVAGNQLFWTGDSNELNAVDLETGEVERNVLAGLFGMKKIVTVWEPGEQFAAFVYRDKIFFPRKETIYAFEPEQRSVTEIAHFDKLTDDEPYACFGTENLMYYKWEGTVRCMNLDTGAVTDLPEMPKVPCAAVHDYLLFVRRDTTGTDDIECYDRNGKTVHP